MKFLIVESSPLPILIPLGPKYSPQDPVFPVKILKALLPSSILATCPTHLNLLDLISLTIFAERTNYEVPHCEVFSTPHSHPSWAQMFASGSCFQIPLACIPPLM